MIINVYLQKIIPTVRRICEIKESTCFEQRRKMHLNSQNGSHFFLTAFSRFLLVGLKSIYWFQLKYIFTRTTGTVDISSCRSKIDWVYSRSYYRRYTKHKSTTFFKISPSHNRRNSVDPCGHLLFILNRRRREKTRN